MVEYSFVVDLAGNRLSPCNKNKSYYLIRKNKAKMLNKFPMVIQLQKIVNDDKNDDVKNFLGIDDGFKLRDYVKYTKRNGVCYIGYITALYPDRKQFNMTTKDNIILKRYGLKSLNLISRPNSIRFS